MNDASCMRPETLKRGLIEVNREDYVRYANELEETFHETSRISGAGYIVRRTKQEVEQALKEVEKDG